LETDVDSGGIFQRGGEVFIEVSSADGQRQQRGVRRLDLGGQHARRRGGRGRRIGPRREEGDVEPALRGVPGAGRPNDSAADDGHLDR